MDYTSSVATGTTVYAGTGPSGSTNLEDASASEGASSGGADNGLLMIAGVAAMVTATVVVAIIVAIRRKRLKESAEGGKPTENDDGLVWDFSAEPDTYDMEARMNHYVATEATDALKSKVSIQHDSSSGSESSRRKSCEGMRVCHLGEIDHLRPWVSEESQTGAQKLASQVQESTFFVCDLCDGIGIIVEATHTCKACGDLYMCTKCHDETHATGDGAFKTHETSLLADQIAMKQSGVVPVLSPISAEGTEGTSSNNGSSDYRTAAPQIEELDRLPFKSEVLPIRAQYIEMRRTALENPDTNQYGFYLRQTAIAASSQLGTKLMAGRHLTNNSQSSASVTSDHASKLNPDERLTSGGGSGCTEGLHTVMPETPLLQIPHNVKSTIKHIPTRRQAIQIRRGRALLARQESENHKKVRALLERRVSDILNVDDIVDNDSSVDATTVSDESHMDDTDILDSPKDLAEVTAASSLETTDILLQPLIERMCESAPITASVQSGNTINRANTVKMVLESALLAQQQQAQQEKDGPESTDQAHSQLCNKESELPCVEDERARKRETLLRVTNLLSKQGVPTFGGVQNILRSPPPKQEEAENMPNKPPTDTATMSTIQEDHLMEDDDMAGSGANEISVQNDVFSPPPIISPVPNSPCLLPSTLMRTPVKSPPQSPLSPAPIFGMQTVISELQLKIRSRDAGENH